MKRLTHLVRGSSSQTPQPPQHEDEHDEVVPETQHDKVEDMPQHEPHVGDNIGATLHSSNHPNNDREHGASTQIRMFILKSNNGEEFEVEEKVAKQLQCISNLVELECKESVIPLPEVTGPVLAKVIDYCKKHAESSNYELDGPNKDLKAWDAEFVKVDDNMLFDIILAANYLDVKDLLDLTCQTVADIIKGTTPEKRRERFHISHDLTPEEEDEIRNENAWLFE